MSGRTATPVVALACAAQFMVVLDVSVVNVALPTIRAALGFDAVGAQWVVTAYALTFAGLLLLGGRLADVFGTRPVLLAGLVVFAGASLVGGLAATPVLLVVARAVQGVGAAVLAPVTLTLLTTTFPEGPRRTRAVAAWTAVGLAGGSAGNLLGGVLTETLSWRWILLVNVPLGAAAVVVALTRLPRPARGPAVSLDLPGAAAVVVGLVALVHGVTSVRERGWGSPATLLVLAVAAVALTAFVVVERRVARSPLFPLGLLRLPAVSIGNVVVLLAGACFVPMWFFLAFLMQDRLGLTPLQTGLGFLPHTLLTMAVGVRVAPWCLQRLPGRTVIAVGALVSAAGFAWQALAVPPPGAPAAGYLAVVLGPAVVMSIGGGLLNTPLTTTVTSGVPRSAAGAASGLMNTTKQVGAALGLAVLTVLAATPTGLSYDAPFAAMALVLVVVAALARMLPGRGGDDRDATRCPRQDSNLRPRD